MTQIVKYDKFNICNLTNIVVKKSYQPRFRRNSHERQKARQEEEVQTQDQANQKKGYPQQFSGKGDLVQRHDVLAGLPGIRLSRKGEDYAEKTKKKGVLLFQVQTELVCY